MDPDSPVMRKRPDASVTAPRPATAFDGDLNAGQRALRAFTHRRPCDDAALRVKGMRRDKRHRRQHKEKLFRTPVMCSPIAGATSLIATMKVGLVEGCVQRPAKLHGRYAAILGNVALVYCGGDHSGIPSANIARRFACARELQSVQDWPRTAHPGAVALAAAATLRLRSPTQSVDRARSDHGPRRAAAQHRLARRRADVAEHELGNLSRRSVNERHAVLAQRGQALHARVERKAPHRLDGARATRRRLSLHYNRRIVVAGH